MVASSVVIRVDLVSGVGREFVPAPGRVLLVGPQHTFRDLAVAIDAAFARWDLAHLCGFDLPGERFIAHSGLLDAQWRTVSPVDYTQVFVVEELAEVDAFEYTFDYGDDWIHRCEVLHRDVDPVPLFGEAPTGIETLFGWGSIPDQYGRAEATEHELETLLV